MPVSQHFVIILEFNLFRIINTRECSRFDLLQNVTYIFIILVNGANTSSGRYVILFKDKSLKER